MSDSGDDVEDSFGQPSSNLESLHDQYDAAAHEPIPYAPQHDSDTSIHLPQQAHDDDLLVNDDPDDPHHSSHDLDAPDELYAEATAAAEAAAAASLEATSAPDLTATDSMTVDVTVLQSALASKEAEVAALKKALELRDRHIVRQATQQSATSLIGEAVLAQSSAAASAASVMSHAGTIMGAAGMDPNKISNLQQRWKARFQQLVCFKLKHGHCNVPKSFDASLHAWVRKQRVNKQIRDQTNAARGLTLHQVASLEALDFDWYVGHKSNDDQWERNYQKVLLLSHEQGHLETTNDKSLNKWMQNQRARRKLLEQKGEGKAKGMTWERVQKLDSIGFRWDTKR